MPSPRARAQAVTAALAAILLAIVACGVRLIDDLQAHQRLRVDLAELNDVKYGLLNADAWVGQLTAIVEKKINEFELTPENRKAVKHTLERMLDVLITEGDRYLRRQAKKADLSERVKEKVRQQLLDLETVKAGIPRYADEILNEMEKPKARRELNQFLKNLLTDVSQSTFAELDTSRLDQIKRDYGCVARPSCTDAIQSRMLENHRGAVRQALLVMVLAVLLFGAVFLSRSRGRLVLLALCCGMLMAIGVLTPMIEVEARISTLSFVLLGEPVEFTEQVLYFQSKSVTDVVSIMMQTRKVDMMVVGVLIMTFSVIFPLLKLAASLGYLYRPRLRDHALVRFFALKSAKWSMADVFVVAMFMAYIGFSGLIASQLSTFALAAKADVDILTTNGTSLQIGFFMFLAFCIAGLLTSTLIESAVAAEDAPREAAAGTP